MRCETIFLLAYYIGVLHDGVYAAKGGKAGGKKGGTSMFPFPGVKDAATLEADASNPNAASIYRYSHFQQYYRLGFKILLICYVKGDPLPKVSWFKDGSEISLKYSTFIAENRFNDTVKRSRLEIDPALAGDQGIYTCMAMNKWNIVVKNFKAEFTS